MCVAIGLSVTAPFRVGAELGNSAGELSLDGEWEFITHGSHDIAGRRWVRKSGQYRGGTNMHWPNHERPNLKTGGIMDAMTDLTLKQRLENNIVLVVLTTAVAAFGAGFGSHAAITGSTGGTASTNTDWEVMAREKTWIPKAECPAFPISLRVLSPGDGATVERVGHWAQMDLVVSSSRPVPEKDAVGVVYNTDGETNYYVKFPGFQANENRTAFRTSHQGLDILSEDAGKRLNVWALAVEDQNLLGSVYGSLEQIKAISSSVFISDKVTVNVPANK
jgi:hypothetical protein